MARIEGTSKDGVVAVDGSKLYVAVLLPLLVECKDVLLCCEFSGCT